MANRSPQPGPKDETSKPDPAKVLVNEASLPITSSSLSVQPEHEDHTAAKPEESMDQKISDTELRSQEAQPRMTDPTDPVRDLARVANSNPDKREGEGALRADGGSRTRTDAVQIKLVTLEALLGHVFEGKSARLLQAQIVCAHHNQMLLAKRLGCDFALVVDGVSFDVHSGFLATGSEVLEEYAFPADGTKSRPTWKYEFDARVHSPMMVDRLLEFMYTGTYQLDKGGRATLLHHPTSLPIGKTKASYPMELEGPIAFHMKMYKMGKTLRYQSLVAVAHTKMAEHMLVKMQIDVGMAKILVNWIYGSTEMAQDIAEQPNDTFGDDNLKELVVACILRHVHQKIWEEEEVEGLKHHAQAYPALEVDWELAEDEYKDVLKTRPETKRAAKRARRGQQHQQEVAKMLQLSEGPHHL